MNKSVPTVAGEGVAFVSKLKKRGQITVDSSLIGLMELEEGEFYQFLLVVKKE